MTKRIVSIALSLCLLISCFTALSITASAAETDKTQTGGQTISVDVSNCDTPDVPTSWYIWTWPDGSDGHLVSGHGEDAYNVYFDDCENNVLVVRCPWGETPNQDWSNVWNQSDDMTIQGSHATVYWGDGEGAHLRVEWGGGSDNSGNNDNNNSGWEDNNNSGWEDNNNSGWDDNNNSGWSDSGSGTVYLNPGDASGAGEWYVWTWGSSGVGTAVAGSQSGGKYSFSGVSDNVIFLSTTGGAPDETWSNVIMQTEDLYLQDGGTYSISGTIQSVDGLSGEPKTKYGGSWSDGSSSYNDDTNYNPDPYIPSPDPYIPSPDPYVNPDPYIPSVQPYYPSTDNSSSSSTKSAGKLTADFMVNGETVNSKEIKGNEIVLTYTLNNNDPLVDAQATINYDSSKLEISSWKFPVIDASVIDNITATSSSACFNFSSPVRPYSFKNGGVLVEVKFKVKSGASGNAYVNFIMEELDSIDTAYVSNSVITSAGRTIMNTLRNVKVVVNGVSGNSSAKKANPMKLVKKTKAVKASKLKKVKVNIKLLAVKNAKGAVKITKVKSGTTKKIYKKIKVNSKNGKITIAKGKYKKGTYKIKLKIVAAGNSTYKKATKNTTVKLKIK